MILLSRSTSQLIADTVKAALVPRRVSGDEDALDIITLAEALTYGSKLRREVGVYEEDLHVIEPRLFLELDAASDSRGNRKVLVRELKADPEGP